MDKRQHRQKPDSRNPHRDEGINSNYLRLLSVLFSELKGASKLPPEPAYTLEQRIEWMKAFLPITYKEYK